VVQSLAWLLQVTLVTLDESQTERRPSWMVEGVKLGRQYAAHHQNRVWHNTINLAHLSFLLTSAFVTLWAARYVSPALYVPLASAALGWTYFGLLVLVVHESSHNMFILAKERSRRLGWNHWFGRMCCVPFAINYERHWQVGHITHHRHPMEDHDPQRYNTKTGKAFWWLFVGLLLVPGFALVERFFSKTNRTRGVSSGHTFVWFTSFWVLGGVVLWRYWSPWALVSAVWGLQVLSALNQLKGALEHGGQIGRAADPLRRSRTTLLPLRFLFMPFNISLHFAHHLNYGVPWYLLGRYHRALTPTLPSKEAAYFVNRAILPQLNGKLP
jgi:fatty acid desaturase